LKVPYASDGKTNGRSNGTMTSHSYGRGFLAGIVAAAAVGATLWFTRRRRSPSTETSLEYPALDDPLDETAAESFPASDPPAHAATLGAKTPA
jgi:hypothetical protein